MMGTAGNIRKRATRGFTLIEVLVALVVVSLALPALILRMQGALDDAAYMRSKTYAHWIAENKLQEMHIRHRLEGDVSKTRKHQDREDYGGQKWFWVVEMEETEVEEMVRMTVSVGFEEGTYLATLSGFLNE